MCDGSWPITTASCVLLRRPVKSSTRVRWGRARLVRCEFPLLPPDLLLQASAEPNKRLLRQCSLPLAFVQLAASMCIIAYPPPTVAWLASSAWSEGCLEEQLQYGSNQACHSVERPVCQAHGRRLGRLPRKSAVLCDGPIPTSCILREVQASQLQQAGSIGNPVSFLAIHSCNGTEYPRKDWERSEEGPFHLQSPLEPSHHQIQAACFAFMCGNQKPAVLPPPQVISLLFPKGLCPPRF